MSRAAPTPNPAPPRVRLICRQIRDDDLDAAVRLLAVGFPERSEPYWRRGLDRLGKRAVPEGYPRYGYVMRDGDRIVGIILLIVSVDPTGLVMGNISSWYVEPAYRSFSGILASMPTRLTGITLVNISPAADTISMIETQGFRRYVAGTFHALACLARRVPGATASLITAADKGISRDLLPLAEANCLCIEVHDGTSTHPFAFLPTRIAKGRLRAAQLVFCRSTEDFVRFAGCLGGALLRHGFASVTLDAVGPVEGVPGLFSADSRVKYYRGPNPPRLNDLSETEIVIFGP